ncbi:hypothetical protein UMZ34_19895 [Halopseudomonas pachastrellae]|nr:hypothetical protein UMZ34_19895 [Halopseudomonas pachastrellae]
MGCWHRADFAAAAFAIGIWMGLRQRIVVYRNHFDVMLVGGLYLIPAAIAGLAFHLGGGGSSDANDGGNELLWAFAALAVVLDALLLLFVLTRTWMITPTH